MITFTFHTQVNTFHQGLECSTFVCGAVFSQLMMIIVLVDDLDSFILYCVQALVKIKHSLVVCLKTFDHRNSRNKRILLTLFLSKAINKKIKYTAAKLVHRSLIIFPTYITTLLCNAKRDGTLCGWVIL